LPSKVVLPVNGPMSHSLESLSKSGPLVESRVDGEARFWDREVGFAITKCRVVFLMMWDG
jgi:hypothetical protein